jgi:hypothetical protein
MECQNRDFVFLEVPMTRSSMAVTVSACTLLLLGGLATGCATTYQSQGLTGGHRETAGPGRLQKVTFSGNGYIHADKVQDFALYRCAELAQQQGKPHFIIYDSLRAAAAEAPSKLPRVGILDNKPSAFAFLLTLDQPRAGAKSTQQVLDTLYSAVHTPPPSNSYINNTNKGVQ